jgi:predicted alpha/beta-hydrolase family hydrolase
VNHVLVAPPKAKALLVLAHGAGAGMRHPFLEKISGLLGERGVATYRYEFLYMEKHSGRPDAPAVAEARVREAVIDAARVAPGLPVFAGGKSFGGRMTSQAQAHEPLPGVHGLGFLGFPLHPPGRPGISRAEHLSEVKIPMLFLQGTRDEFAGLDLLRPIVKKLGKSVTLHVVEGGDHSFKVLKRTGRTEGDVMSELADTITAWAGQHA